MSGETIRNGYLAAVKATLNYADPSGGFGFTQLMS